MGHHDAVMGLTWVHDRIYADTQDPEVWHETMSWADNPFLDERELKVMEQALTPQQRRSRQYGEFASGNGLVYPEFDEQVNVVEPFEIPPQWQSMISIDPGFVNPLSASLVRGGRRRERVCDGGAFCRRKGLRMALRGIKEISRRQGWKTDNAGRYAALIDNAALQRTLSGTKSVAQLFSEQGIAANPKVDKSVWSGIQRVRQYLGPPDGRPKLYVFSTCREMIKEFRVYRFGQGEEPIRTTMPWTSCGISWPRVPGGGAAGAGRNRCAKGYGAPYAQAGGGGSACLFTEASVGKTAAADAVEICTGVPKAEERD